MSRDSGSNQVGGRGRERYGQPRPPPGHWLAAGLLAGGLLVMGGAVLPWLTLYAGLYGYRGTTGLYGWLAFAAGALAFAAGLATIRFGPPWLGRASAAFGGALFVFTAWLLSGLLTVLHRPAAAMLVPRPGPGLFLLLAGAALILLAPAAERVFVGDRSACRQREGER